MQQDSLQQRKLLSALCHGSGLFSWTMVAIGVPLCLMLLAEDEIVKENAKEALNFQINVFLYGIVFALLCFVLIGFPLLFLLGIASLVLPILAIVRIANDPSHIYRYPFIFRLF